MFRKLGMIVAVGSAVFAASCVPVTLGPPATGGTAVQTGPVGGPTLAGSLAGRAFVDPRTGQTLNLWSDGSYTVSTGPSQSFGTWRAVEATSQMCFTGPVAAYAGGACVPIRWDGDALTLFDVTQSVAMEAWIPV